MCEQLGGHFGSPFFDDIDNVEFLPPILCRVLAAILKMADILKILKTQNCSSNCDLLLSQNFMSLSLSS